MKLLILTQAVDINDPVLGFFHQWIEALAARTEQIEVICLKEGIHNLPSNVQVYSLGKEGGKSRIKYLARFFSYAWSLRHEYDAVFVHMNEEYVVLGGWLWRLMGKRIYMWRNYHRGTIMTDIAAAFCTNVFCTSKHSYTARYKKTMLMPVGVDSERFFPDTHIERIPHSILFLSGMWPSKRPEMLIEALVLLQKEGVTFTADFYGSPLSETEGYYESLKTRVADAGLSSTVSFSPGPANAETPNLYRSHEIFVNCSPSGMFDKTLFEAAASGCRVLAVSDDLAAISEESYTHFTTAEELAASLTIALAEKSHGTIPTYVEANSLAALVRQLGEVIH